MLFTSPMTPTRHCYLANFTGNPIGEAGGSAKVLIVEQKAADQSLRSFASSCHEGFG
jgi:hypothetical protein